MNHLDTPRKKSLVKFALSSLQIGVCMRMVSDMNMWCGHPAMLARGMKNIVGPENTKIVTHFQTSMTLGRNPIKVSRLIERLHGSKTLAL